LANVIVDGVFEYMREYKKMKRKRKVSFLRGKRRRNELSISKKTGIFYLFFLCFF